MEVSPSRGKKKMQQQILATTSGFVWPRSWNIRKQLFSLSTMLFMGTSVLILRKSFVLAWLFVRRLVSLQICYQALYMATSPHDRRRVNSQTQQVCFPFVVSYCIRQNWASWRWPGSVKQASVEKTFVCKSWSDDLCWVRLASSTWHVSWFWNTNN